MLPQMQVVTKPNTKGSRSVLPSFIFLLRKSTNSIPDKGATKDGRANRLSSKKTASTSLNSELRSCDESKSTSKDCWLTSLISGSSSLGVTNLAAYPRNGCPLSNLPSPSAYSFNYAIKEM